MTGSVIGTEWYLVTVPCIASEAEEGCSGGKNEITTLKNTCNLLQELNYHSACERCTSIL